jgi:hypothetical protein
MAPVTSAASAAKDETARRAAALAAIINLFMSLGLL